MILFGRNRRLLKHLKTLEWEHFTIKGCYKRYQSGPWTIQYYSQNNEFFAELFKDSLNLNLPKVAVAAYTHIRRHKNDWLQERRDAAIAETFRVQPSEPRPRR